MADRIVLHVDMDYFFAQIEEREDRALSGIPVAVCIFSGRENSLGAVGACNYEARRYGVKSGMACSIAKKKCPELRMIAARKDHYLAVSESVMETIRGFSEQMEQVSVDEAYLDVSGKTTYPALEGYIGSLKRAVLESQRLTCSVGAGPNKIIAKMASSINKPDGHMIVLPSEVEGFLSGKSASELFGVGEKTAERLDAMGVKTVIDLRRMSREELVNAFGNAKGAMLYWSSRGIDDSPVSPRKKEQYGRLRSLPRESPLLADVKLAFSGLPEDVLRLLARDGRSFRKITLIFVLNDMTMRTKTRTMASPTSDVNTLKKTSDDMISEFMSEGRIVRRVGLSVSGLSAPTGQRTLFDF